MRKFMAIIIFSAFQKIPLSAQITNDYPSQALKEGREGTAFYTVEVNEQGRAENCRIIKSSGSDDLDEATCRVVTMRARFNPQKDPEGNIIRGSYSNKVVWRIPK